MPKFKKHMKIKEPNKELPYNEFKELISGFTDEEINRLRDLLERLQ